MRVSYFSYKQKIKMKYRKEKILVWSKNIPLVSSFTLSCIQKGTHSWQHPPKKSYNFIFDFKHHVPRNIHKFFLQSSQKGLLGKFLYSRLCPTMILMEVPLGVSWKKGCLVDSFLTGIYFRKKFNLKFSWLLFSLQDSPPKLMLTFLVYIFWLKKFSISDLFLFLLTETGKILFMWTKHGYVLMLNILF